MVRVEVRDPVRPAGEVDRAVLEREVDRGRVRRERDEDLEEEEGHDREVVADEAPRGQADQEPDDRGDDHCDDGRQDRRQVDVELVGGEEGVGVGADPEERDVAEVEQPAPADDDVQPEGEQGEDEDVEADQLVVLVRGQEREQAREDDDAEQLAPARDAADGAVPQPAGAAAAAGPLAARGDPLVDADARLAELVLLLARELAVARRLIPSSAPRGRRAPPVGRA